MFQHGTITTSDGLDGHTSATSSTPSSLPQPNRHLCVLVHFSISGNGNFMCQSGISPHQFHQCHHHVPLDPQRRLYPPSYAWLHLLPFLSFDQAVSPFSPRFLRYTLSLIREAAS
ncbi:hypothetical protein CEUSTIGMA_g2768.t1 [Chlamydomonas eustigma]|uniref:Uncharacterized protein n=1 Tax=Chlamydomonas eustigma TaxID=1157962 RepID=A0A250WWU6_9CHLO|nr:hypothetical protein CEUSTIGMA_g2768.t1 [Chlamydomonas eustigma]|eukprot:GAX75323.1 hypothetical protein CEUSTIGMA_g2768.t1 [Chlamydomonas eustigma]